MKLGRTILMSLSLVILISFPALGRQLKPVFDPDNFISGLQNQYFPLVLEAFWNYSADNGETEHAEVLNAATDHCQYPKTVAGVSVFVVQDQVFDENGALIEDTCDWYAPDNEGNVWYLGEDAQQMRPATSWERRVRGRPE